MESKIFKRAAKLLQLGYSLEQIWQDKFIFKSFEQIQDLKKYLKSNVYPTQRLKEFIRKCKLLDSSKALEALANMNKYLKLESHKPIEQYINHLIKYNSICVQHLSNIDSLIKSPIQAQIILEKLNKESFIGQELNTYGEISWLVLKANDQVPFEEKHQQILQWLKNASLKNSEVGLDKAIYYIQDLYNQFKSISSQKNNDHKTVSEEAKEAFEKYSLDYYKGTVSNGQVHGFGILIEQDGSKYIGQFQNGLANGWGEQFWSNGDTYKGNWENDKFHGQGELSEFDGSWYKGEFLNNKAHGYGVQIFNNGSKYEGQWKDDEMTGEGIFTDKDGNQNQLWNGLAFGKGKLKLENGDLYEGEIENGQMNGRGVLKGADGSLHEGLFENNQANGHGIKTWQDQTKYMGNWKDNEMHGYGILVYEDGQKYEGNFQKGKLNGEGSHHMGNQEYYQGQWKKGKMEGKGTFYQSDGTKFQGWWKNNLKHGKGQLITCDGQVIRQTWKNGVLLDD